MSMKMPERRRFIRIEVPLSVRIDGNGWTENAVTKNISPIGMRVQTVHKLEVSEIVKCALEIPTSENEINVEGKVVWQKRVNLEDNSPYEVGIELTNIEDTSKTILLKYLCDLLYDSSYHS